MSSAPSADSTGARRNGSPRRSARDAARAAEALAPLLTRLDSRLSRFHATDRYIRKSLSNGLQADIATAVQQCGGSLARAHLPPRAAEALSRVERVARLDAFEAAREEANSRFVAARAPAVVSAASGVLSSPPTGEQAEAIATDEDTTLVLAGAGTGKTAVITAKVAHLVRNQGVPPDEILVLAFNRKAAEEIRERLPDDLAGAHVATFHAFGRRVIADVEVAPSMSKLAEDEARLIAVVDRILVELVSDPRQSRAVTNFITSQRADYRSQFDFATPGEYYDYIRRSELRTLTGDLVKSFEELEIANFLTLNGVGFTYEARYEVESATSWNRQYLPVIWTVHMCCYPRSISRTDRAVDRGSTHWGATAEGALFNREGVAADFTTSCEDHGDELPAAIAGAGELVLAV